MKKILLPAALIAAIALTSCGGSDSKSTTAAGADSSATKKATVTPINEADWELKEFKITDKDEKPATFTVKLPKDVTITADTIVTGTFSVVFKNKYELSIMFSSYKTDKDIAADLQSDKKRNVDTTDKNQVYKILAETSNGLAYTSQTVYKGETSEPPVGYFFHYTPYSKGGIMKVTAVPAPLITPDERYDLYSPESTQKIFDIVAKSAAFK